MLYNFYESSIAQNKSIKDLFYELSKREDVEFYLGDKKVRLFYHKGTDNLCQYKKNSKSWGFYLSDNQIKNLKYRIIQKRKSPEQVWYDSWKKVLDSLKKWDINRELALDIEELLKLSLQKVIELSGLYWDNREEYKKELAKYNVSRDIGCLWLSERPAKVKKMRFKKRGFQDEYYQKIEHAITYNQECNIIGDNGYDVNFSFYPKNRSAYYSEEFKGCANGHYYMAISPTHALFVEND